VATSSSSTSSASAAVAHQLCAASAAICAYTLHPVANDAVVINSPARLDSAAYV
jgi:hypothetical protein